MGATAVDVEGSASDKGAVDFKLSDERAAQRLLVQAAERALENNEDQRFDQLVAQLAGPRPATANDQTFDMERESRMDAWRRLLAALLILGLIVIIALSVGMDSQFAGEYVPLLSGLAGIAIGWLYSGSTSHHVTQSGENA